MSAAKLLGNGRWTMRWVRGENGLDAREVAIVLPIKTVSELNQREHWAAQHRRRRKQRADVALVVGVMLRQESIGVPCTVTLTRIAPRAMDGDNLQGALKAVRDGVADALGVDDGSGLVTWQYGQRRGGAKAFGVEIVVGQRPW